MENTNWCRCELVVLKAKVVDDNVGVDVDGEWGKDRRQDVECE